MQIDMLQGSLPCTLEHEEMQYMTEREDLDAPRFCCPEFNTTGEMLHDRLQFIFLELARFNKTEDNLETPYDKWMFLFKNMPLLKSRPKVTSLPKNLGNTKNQKR